MDSLIATGNTAVILRNLPVKRLWLSDRENSGRKYAYGSYFPPTEEGLATRSRRVNALKKCSQPSGGPKLRNSFQFLEDRSEHVRYTPHCTRRELLMLRIEVVIVHGSGQMLWDIQLAIHKGPGDEKLQSLIS